MKSKSTQELAYLSYTKPIPWQTNQAHDMILACFNRKAGVIQDQWETGPTKINNTAMGGGYIHGQTHSDV
jgi:hypothetical protein|tara:strand:+ start:2345 stop:2554 length:210 start_codon:yes stop_codon:yes gene_type:complete